MASTHYNKSNSSTTSPRRSRKPNLSLPTSVTHLMPSPETWRDRAVGGYYVTIITDAPYGEACMSGPVKQWHIMPYYSVSPHSTVSHRGGHYSYDSSSSADLSSSSSQSDFEDDFVFVPRPRVNKLKASPDMSFGSMTLKTLPSKTSSYSNLGRVSPNPYSLIAKPTPPVETVRDYTELYVASVSETRVPTIANYDNPDSDSDLETHLLTCNIPHTVRLVPPTKYESLLQIPSFHSDINIVGKEDAQSNNASGPVNDVAPQPPVDQPKPKVKERIQLDPTHASHRFISTSPAPSIYYRYWDPSEEDSLFEKLDRSYRRKCIRKLKGLLKKFRAKF